jgi:ABC-type Fe3+ transport system substrate-binding protein
MLQTLHDFPRGKKEGTLMYYAPLNFSNVYPDLRDVDAAYHATAIFTWSNLWNTEKMDAVPKEYTDFLKPEYKDKLVLTYPNDDAVLFAFDLMYVASTFPPSPPKNDPLTSPHSMQKYGTAWFDALLQNPHWVRGTATLATLIASPNTSYTITFTTTIGIQSQPLLNISYPIELIFVSWPQTGAILKDAPHPKGAKLLRCFLISEEYQRVAGSWSNPMAFGVWIGERGYVERLRF